MRAQERAIECQSKAAAQLEPGRQPGKKQSFTRLSRSGFRLPLTLAGEILPAAGCGPDSAAYEPPWLLFAGPALE